MSDHSEPYANGFGILAGILILWVGTFALCVIFKSLFYGGPEAGGKEEEQESRAGTQGVDVATLRAMECHKRFILSDAISQADLPGIQRV
jgi:hypothetical protein